MTCREGTGLTKSGLNTPLPPAKNGNQGDLHLHSLLLVTPFCTALSMIPDISRHFDLKLKTHTDAPPPKHNVQNLLLHQHNGLTLKKRCHETCTLLGLNSDFCSVPFNHYHMASIVSVILSSIDNILSNEPSS